MSGEIRWDGKGAWWMVWESRRISWGRVVDAMIFVGEGGEERFRYWCYV
jgi:hypothetical protein